MDNPESLATLVTQETGDDKQMTKMQHNTEN